MAYRVSERQGQRVPTIIIHSVRESIDNFIMPRVFWGKLFLIRKNDYFQEIYSDDPDLYSLRDKLLDVV